MTPDRTLLHTVLQRLRDHGITAALGGSGLLYSLGLVDSVRDWDLTTDAPLEAVAAALVGLNWSKAANADGRYGTSYRLSIRDDLVEIDLMGSFSFRLAAGLCHMPTVVSAVWESIPVGSPEVWAVAYQLMGRQPKADMLFAYISRKGADQRITQLLLAEPLPVDLRTVVQSW